MGKKCDLCDGVARMFCESDQASLCWDCDAQVHGANFLVAKHTRCLLCSACQSPTPWKASGLRLGPTFSVCDSCLALKSAAGVSSTDRILTEIPGQVTNGFQEDRLRDDEGDGAESYDDDEDEDEDEEYSDEDEDEDDVDDEEAENQVVPWAAAAAAQPPPIMSSSSSDGGGGDLVAKRTRDCSDDEIGCSSVQESNYSRPSKRPSRDEPAFKSTAAINSIIRLEGERSLNGAVDSCHSSSSSLFFAISKTTRDLSR